MGLSADQSSMPQPGVSVSSGGKRLWEWARVLDWNSVRKKGVGSVAGSPPAALSLVISSAAGRGIQAANSL